MTGLYTSVKFCLGSYFFFAAAFFAGFFTAAFFAPQAFLLQLI